MKMMKTQFHLTRTITSPSFLIIPTRTTSYSYPKHPPFPISQSARISIISSAASGETPGGSHSHRETRDVIQKPLKMLESKREIVALGAVSVGFVLLVMVLDEQKALALGPEGPLVEEFWENVRRYALYALTVSTGALYTIFQPIFELLRNPISAILLLVIFGGSIFIVSQVLSAMVGVTDFSYDYGY